MPIINIDPPTYEESVARSSTQDSIANLPKDQMAALVSNIANAVMADVTKPLKTSTIVEKNLQDIQAQFSSMSKRLICKLDDQELILRVKAPEVNSDLPIMENIDEKGNFVKSSINLLSLLPTTLQKPGSIVTILDLLKEEFPRLALSNLITEIPKRTFTVPIPVNQEGKGNFFPQIEVDGQIAYVAWDSSGSRIARGFTEKTCDVLLENNEAFCGAVLSQNNLEAIEEGAGVAAHFLTSKVTVIGILVTKPSSQDWVNRLVCDGPSSLEIDSFDDREFSSFNSVCPKGLTTFGVLGVQGASVLSDQNDLPDRLKREGEKLIPFCFEIIPQFSSKERPVNRDDLEMAMDMQFQNEIFSKYQGNYKE